MKLFVWDFHGVLEKGNEKAAVLVSNLVLEQFGYRQRFSEADGDRLYGAKWYQYFEDLLPGEDHERHMQLQEACFDYDRLHPEIVEGVISRNDHALEVVDAIARRHTQVVISNTKPEAILRFVRAVALEQYFTPDNTVAVDLHRRDAERTKKDILARYLREHAYEQIVIIGDSASDMALVDVAGGVRYLYAHSGRAFRLAEADFRIRDLRDVLKSL